MTQGDSPAEGWTRHPPDKSAESAPQSQALACQANDAQADCSNMNVSTSSQQRALPEGPREWPSPHRGQCRGTPLCSSGGPHAAGGRGSAAPRRGSVTCIMEALQGSTLGRHGCCQE